MSANTLLMQEAQKGSWFKVFTMENLKAGMGKDGNLLKVLHPIQSRIDQMMTNPKPIPDTVSGSPGGNNTLFIDHALRTDLPRLKNTPATDWVMQNAQRYQESLNPPATHRITIRYGDSIPVPVDKYPDYMHDVMINNPYIDATFHYLYNMNATDVGVMLIAFAILIPLGSYLGKKLVSGMKESIKLTSFVAAVGLGLVMILLFL